MWKSTLVFVSVALLMGGLPVAKSLTLDELQYTEATCFEYRAEAISSGTAIPCPCRLNTGSVTASACYPDCCPKTDTFEGDRCHTENKATWTVYEQKVCYPSPPVEYTDQTPNCFYRGNIPLIKGNDVVDGKTHLTFELSIKDEHQCDDLYIAACNPERVIWDDFRINTTDAVPQYCWLNCAPKAVSECTATSCWANRGQTDSVIHEWTLDRQLPAGDYALICYTMVQGESVGSELWQTAYASIGFKAP